MFCGQGLGWGGGRKRRKVNLENAPELSAAVKSFCQRPLGGKQVPGGQGRKMKSLRSSLLQTLEATNARDCQESLNPSLLQTEINLITEYGVFLSMNLELLAPAH